MSKPRYQFYIEVPFLLRMRAGLLTSYSLASELFSQKIILLQKKNPVSKLIFKILYDLQCN